MNKEPSVESLQNREMLAEQQLAAHLTLLCRFGAHGQDAIEIDSKHIMSD